MDDFAGRVETALRYRNTIIEEYKSLSISTHVSRDEIIEALATRRIDFDHNGGRSSQDADSRMIALISKADSIYSQARGAAATERHRATQLYNLVRDADRYRLRLPLHLQRVLDLVYYQKLTHKDAAAALKLDPERFEQRLREAVQALSEYLRSKQ